MILPKYGPSDPGGSTPNSSNSYIQFHGANSISCSESGINFFKMRVSSFKMVDLWFLKCIELLNDGIAHLLDEDDFFRHPSGFISSSSPATHQLTNSSTHQLINSITQQLNNSAPHPDRRAKYSSYRSGASAFSFFRYSTQASISFFFNAVSARSSSR